MILASPDFGAEAGVHFIQLGLAMLVATTFTHLFTSVVSSRRPTGAGTRRGRVAISLGGGFLGFCSCIATLNFYSYVSTGPCEDLVLPSIVGLVAAMVVSVVFVLAAGPGR
jgi:hypothetical protein